MQEPHAGAMGSLSTPGPSMCPRSTGGMSSSLRSLLLGSLSATSLGERA